MINNDQIHNIIAEIEGVIAEAINSEDFEKLLEARLLLEKLQNKILSHYLRNK